jgi:hypothetical protein
MVLGMFALGCLTGASLDSAYRIRARNNERQEKRGGRDKEQVFEHLKRDLNLSEQQATAIRAILEQTRNDYRALRAEVRPRYDGVRQNARTRIRALLTPESPSATPNAIPKIETIIKRPKVFEQLRGRLVR